MKGKLGEEGHAAETEVTDGDAVPDQEIEVRGRDQNVADLEPAGHAQDLGAGTDVQGLDLTPAASTAGDLGLAVGLRMEEDQVQSHQMLWSRVPL